MQLADDITITLAGEAVTLRPSLRCAVRLERRPGSFARLLREIMDGSLTAACEIIAPHHGHVLLEYRVFEAGLDNLKEPLVEYVMACAGMEPDTRPETSKAGKSIPFSEYLTGLYRIGTGWLGWSPETTLDATPAEIIEAYTGRMDMLKAIFGSSEDKASQQSTMPLDEKFRTVFGSFGTTKIDRRAA